MAAPPARARADYDCLIKLLLIGDSVRLLLIAYCKLANVLLLYDLYKMYPLMNEDISLIRCSALVQYVIFKLVDGVGKSCLLLRFSDGSFTTSFITTIGIDFKIRTIELDGKRIKLQIWDTAGQERFRTITTVHVHLIAASSFGVIKLHGSVEAVAAPFETSLNTATVLLNSSFAAYYRGAMGILLVYDVTDEASFNNIRNWIRNIEQHASDNVNKILAVPTSKGQALADEYGIKFFETSAKTNMNVEEVFFSIARDIKQRLADSDSKTEPQTIKINQPDQNGGAAKKSACCG
ncbi:hypothetical protein SASPL_108512 [Salvia splendens]|uniref:Ras-related protein Rab-11A n=1 Tax=Salvia splendens TaxID=180675 RepID=A0A8X8YI93_SALSN|nr:hypothetical protein SASPL_108512 [Salvia splendens]